MEGLESGMHADFVDDAVRTLRAAAPGELSRVTEAAAVLAHGDHLLVQVVREARAAGRSWSEIATALETSTAIARQRWGSPRQGADRTDVTWSRHELRGADASRFEPRLAHTPDALGIIA